MFPLLVGVVVLLSGGVAAFMAENHGPLDPDKLYAGSLGALIFLAAGPLTETLLARRYGPRARVDLWRSVQFAALLLSLATWLQLSPLFSRPSYLSGGSSRWEQLGWRLPEAVVSPVASGSPPGSRSARWPRCSLRWPCWWAPRCASIAPWRPGRSSITCPR